MTIDETIKFCEEKSKNIKLKAEPQVFIQLAEWLEELKANKVTSAEIYESGYKRGYGEGYTKAIDDFAEALKGNVMTITFGARVCDIDRIAEQLKKGDADNE